MPDGISNTVDAPRPTDPIASGIVTSPDRPKSASDIPAVEPAANIVHGWDAEAAVSTAATSRSENLGTALPAAGPVREADSLGTASQDARPVGGVQGLEEAVNTAPAFDPTKIGGERSGDDPVAPTSEVGSRFGLQGSDPEAQTEAGGIYVQPRSAAVVAEQPQTTSIPEDHKSLGQKIGEGLKKLWPFGKKAQTVEVSNTGVIAGPVAGIDSSAVVPGVDATPGQVPQTQPQGQAA